MRQLVKSYAFAWHPQRGCQLRLKLEGQDQWLSPVHLSAVDFAAAAQVLRKKPVYFEDGGIFTGSESGDDN